MKLRSQLVVLTLVTLLPVAILAAVFAAFLIDQQRETFGRGTEDRVRALVTAVDTELNGSIDLLRALANVRSLDERDLKLFRQSAEQILHSQDNWSTINLALPDGQQIVNLLVPEGERLPKIPAQDESTVRIAQTMKPVVGDLIMGPSTKRWDFAVRVPVVREGKLRYILSAVVKPESIKRLVASQGLPPNWEGMVIDRHGRIVARTVEPESVGAFASANLREALNRAESGWFRGTNLEGVPKFRAYRRSETSGWAFAMAIPIDAVDGNATRAAFIFGLAVAGVALLAFVLARAVGSRITSPISALAAATDQLAQGASVEIEETARIDELRSLERALRSAAGAQLALRQAEERTRSVVDHVVDGIITIDEAGSIESFNRAAEKLFGYSAPEVLGKNVKLLMPEPHRGAHDTYIANYVRTGQAKIIGVGREVSGQREDRSTFPMELAVSEFRLGTRRFFTGIVRDISERKQAEQALRDADRHKDEFLAVLGHELRNPLAAIHNAVTVMHLRGPISEELTNALGIIKRQIAQMSRLVDDLLDVSRIGSGKLVLNKERLAIGGTVAAAVEAVRPLLEASHHELILALASQPLYVEADRSRLLQIVQNLLTNAARYTPPGGKIVLTASRDGRDVVLSVKDNGIGIPSELLQHIFDPFTQGTRPAEREGGGLGLGLALVRRLTELHGGSVLAASEGPGLGAEFLVSLPAHDEDENSAAAEAAHAARSLSGGRRVLVVRTADDARTGALTTMLRSRGDDVRVVHDGVTGVAMADALKPHVVLLDVGFDGYEACRRIRERPWGRRACVVARATADAPSSNKEVAAATWASELQYLIDQLFTKPNACAA